MLVGEFSDADGPAKADRFIFRLFLSSTPNTKLYREGGKQKTIVCFNVVYRRPTLHRTEKARTDTEDFKAAKKKKIKKMKEKKKKSKTLTCFCRPPTLYHPRHAYFLSTSIIISSGDFCLLFYTTQK